MRLTDHEQRQLDQRSGEEQDRRAAARHPSSVAFNVIMAFGRWQGKSLKTLECFTEDDRHMLASIEHWLISKANVLIRTDEKEAMRLGVQILEDLGRRHS